MATLEDLKPNSQVSGILPSGPVTILSVQRHGSGVVEVTYRDMAGKLGSELLFRDRQADLEVSVPGRPWAFDADPEMFRLVSEAYRIRMAYLFDTWLAIHISLVEPLPHQITAVYGEMLPRQPLRFLLADDPGASKTIMTGLFIKELILRGDMKHCLIVSPGNLTEQWQYSRGSLQYHLIFLKGYCCTLSSQNHPTQRQRSGSVNQRHSYHHKPLPQHRIIQRQIAPFIAKRQTHPTNKRFVKFLRFDPLVFQPARQSPLFARRVCLTHSIHTPLAQMDCLALQQSYNRLQKGGKTAHIVKSRSALENKVSYVTIKVETITHSSLQAFGV